ncbi:hypothetical protein EV127DRAFT_399380 [Xylaria flabelliformis]|nr:hypothetical protein EV127DRAFT_399380 [Xylaria flabelliformis]
MEPSGFVILATGNEGISLTGFYVLNWLFFALCIITFSARLAIRWICFQKLLIEDFVMVLAVLLHSAEAVLGYLYIQGCYLLEGLERGQVSPLEQNLFPKIQHCVKGFGYTYTLTTLGTFFIKLNFLLFFRRLGSNVRIYNILWWCILAINIAATVGLIADEDFGCFFGDIGYVFSSACTDKEALFAINARLISSSAIDAITDILVFMFPVIILWRSRVNLRQKLILTIIFSLVFFTIAVTIVRGTIFTTVYSSAGTENGKEVELSFAWFWYYIEFSVAIIIACALSFRSLFVRKDQKLQERRQEERQQQAARPRITGWRLRARNMHDSLITTCKDLEGWSDTESPPSLMFGLPQPASGLMTVNFEDDANWARGTPGTEAHIMVDRTVSVQSLLQRPTEAHDRGREVLHDVP